MKQKRNGFTLVEVMLFLAVSGLLMLGVFGMTQTSIRAQRYNDSVQNFAEFLRRVYSAVENPQGIGNGRSEYAIYGKLVTFGESYDTTGAEIKDKQKFFVYDVVGSSDGIGSGDVATMLRAVNANVVMTVKEGSQDVASPAGIVESYEPTWGAAIDKSGVSNNGKLFTGSLLVVRHSRSGTISTLFSNEVVQVNDTLRRYSTNVNNDAVKNLLLNKLDSFSTRQVDFCVNPTGYKLKSNTRRDVRVIAGARNISGVELIAQDSDDNKCDK